MVHSRNAIILIILLLTSICSAEIIFQDNFDDHSDWSPTQPATGGELTSGDGDDTTPCTGCPDGDGVYAGYLVARTGFSAGRIGEDTISITSFNARGGSGKAFTLWAEPVETTLCTDWCNDGLLVVDLGAQYQTVYLRYYVKFDAGWAWDDDANSVFKTLHMQNYTGPGAFWNYFETGSNWPIGLPSYANENGAWSGQAVYRMQLRKSSCYLPLDGYTDVPGDVINNDFIRYGITDDTLNCTLGSDCDTWANTIMDGNWHLVEQKFQGNSAQGVIDGEWEMWLDGVKIISKTDIPWADDGEQSDGTIPCTDTGGGVIDPPNDFQGFNMLALGGNMFNELYANTSSTNVEQYYTIDDLVISTTYVGPDSPDSKTSTASGNYSIGTE